MMVSRPGGVSVVTPTPVVDQSAAFSRRLVGALCAIARVRGEAKAEKHQQKPDWVRAGLLLAAGAVERLTVDPWVRQRPGARAARKAIATGAGPLEPQAAGPGPQGKIVWARPRPSPTGSG